MEFKWQSEQQAAFDKLKELITSTTALAYFDVNSKTRIVADASPVGLGAVLIQLQGVEWRVIAYASRGLTDVERRYSQTEREALALVWACERFNPLSPNSDQHQFSPNKIHRLSRAKSMRINKMITKRKVFDLESKFSRLIF